jgi:hypothetical protein
VVLRVETVGITSTCHVSSQAFTPWTSPYRPLIADIATSAGTQATLSGLGQISAFVANGQADATVESVYGGDLPWRERRLRGEAD